MIKLLVITSVKEYQKDVARIMNLSGIEVFSVTATVGFKDHHQPNLLDNWFSSGGEAFDSIFLFSFTDTARAKRAIELVAHYNAGHQTGFPMRAFVLNVEQSSEQSLESITVKT